MARGFAAVLVLAVLAAPAPLHALGPFEPAVDSFGSAVTAAFAPDGSMFVADEDVGATSSVSPRPSLTPSTPPAEAPGGGAVPGISLVIVGLLVAGLLLMRRRLLRP